MSLDPRVRFWAVPSGQGNDLHKFLCEGAVAEHYSGSSVEGHLDPPVIAIREGSSARGKPW